MARGSVLNRIAMRAGSSSLTSPITGIKRQAGPRGRTNYVHTRGDKKGKFVSHGSVAARGYGVMGGGAGGGFVLNRASNRSSGGRGAPPAHSSGGHMLM